MAGIEGSNRSVEPTAPPRQWFGAAPNDVEAEPPRYQSLTLEHSNSPDHRETEQYPKSPRSRTRRNTLNRSIAFAGEFDLAN